jgi:hypothetical protein
VTGAPEDDPRKSLSAASRQLSLPHEHSDIADQGADDARTALGAHRTDADTGRCEACGSDSPCRLATQAANLSAETGVLDPAPTASQPRLTYGWRLVFGLSRRPARPPAAPADDLPLIEGEWR